MRYNPKKQARKQAIENVRTRATAYLSGKGKGFLYDPDVSSNIPRSPKNQHNALTGRQAIRLLQEELAKISKELDSEDAHEDPASYMEYRGMSHILEKAIHRLAGGGKGPGRPKRQLPSGVSRKKLGRIAQASGKSVSKAQDSVQQFLEGDHPPMGGDDRDIPY